MIIVNVFESLSVQQEKKRQKKIGNMSSRRISKFERLLRVSHESLEGQAADVKSALRDVKDTKSEDKDFDQLLKDLKQVGYMFIYAFH